MQLHRRALLSALGASAAGAASAEEAASPRQAPPSLEASISARAAENRHRLAFDGARFSGPAYELMLEEGRRAQFFCVGEEHGVAENPKLCAQLFADLTGAGYAKACVEVSPPIAAELDLAARGGVDGVRSLLADPRASAAFFGMRMASPWCVRPGRISATHSAAR